MKRKIYYRYNPQSLSYERVYPSLKSRIFVVIRHLTSGIIIGFSLFWGLKHVFGSPSEIALEKDIQLMETQYDVLSKQMDEAVSVLHDIQQRDDNMYRAIYHTNPIPSSIRHAGIGGIGRYDHLMQLSNPKLIVQTTQKMDYIARQLYVQSNSFDQIIQLAKGQKDRIKHIPSIQPVSDKNLSRIASGYGNRIDPVYGTPRFHAGMDFAAATGTPIYATGNGTIVFADWRQGYGKCIILDHGFGYETLYGHMDEYVAHVGQKVVRGEQIGKVGNTGKSTGPHLHYEVHINGQVDNPAKYYFMDLTPEEYDRLLQISANHGQVMD